MLLLAFSMSGCAFHAIGGCFASILRVHRLPGETQQGEVIAAETGACTPAWGGREDVVKEGEQMVPAIQSQSSAACIRHCIGCVQRCRVFRARLISTCVCVCVLGWGAAAGVCVDPHCANPQRKTTPARPRPAASEYVSLSVVHCCN